MLRFAFAACSFLLFAATAAASDGVVEISQACATATGCFPGDAPGFPVEIQVKGGSYRLTGNLDVATNVRAIFVNHADVNLDLNGFVIMGPNTCSGSGAQITCSGPGLLPGILASGLGSRIANGTIRGFHGGIEGGDRIVVNGVTVTRNSYRGIWIGDGSIVSNTSSIENGDLGILVGDSIVRDCLSLRNRLAGIAGSNLTVEGSRVTGNGADGVDAALASLIRGNFVSGNNGIGIRLTANSAGSLIENNSVSKNALDGIVVSKGALVSGNTSAENGQSGIAALSTSSLERNTVTKNSTYGTYLYPEHGGAAAAYRGNVIAENTVGTVVNGINLGQNSCNGTTTCP